MTDHDPAATTPPRRSRLRFLLTALLFLAALGVLTYAGWKLARTRADTEETLDQQDALLRQINRQLTLEQGQLNELEGRFADLNQTSRNSTDQIGAMQNRLDDAEQALVHMQATLQGGRIRMQLLTVEQLLQMANDRAQLTHDARTSAAALSVAQDRLGTIANPQLFEVRKAVAEERAALEAVPAVDISGAALTLGALIERIARLPLRAGVPEQFMPPSTAAAPASPHSWHERLLNKIGGAFHALFTVRRTEQPVPRLMLTEQQAMIGEVLALRLEAARTALLRADTPAFHDALKSAGAWLDDYYRSDDPGVLAAQADIEKLQALDLSPALPDLSRSLRLLRAYLDTTPK